LERPLTQYIRPGGEPLDLKGYEQGGAGFPTAMKWTLVPMGDDAPHPKYLLINADEMEPGTFEDRFLLEGAPHQLIEGLLLSAYAIPADVAYIFLRWAYKLAERRVARAIAQAYDAAYLEQNILASGWGLELHLLTSAGPGDGLCGDGVQGCSICVAAASLCRSGSGRLSLAFCGLWPDCGGFDARW
jgi:NADH:ubiquinone oxidoreductase subunit F (NADH-binding)